MSRVVTIQLDCGGWRTVADGVTERWYDRNGQPHRGDNKPAVVSPYEEVYYVRGRLHRTDGPAICYHSSNSYAWYVKDVRIESWEQLSYEANIPMQEVFKLALTCEHQPSRK